MALFNRGFSGKSDANDDRLPPGQSLVEPWPVLTYGPTPRIDKNEWSITIDGAVKKPLTLDWKQFNELTKTDLKTDVHCVTHWSRYDMDWQGVLVDELIAKAGGLTDEANFLIASSYGGYSTNLPIKDVTEGKAMVATHAHGEPLTPEHGGPARLFVPHLYLWKSAKYVNKLTFTPDDRPGFWEVNGYHNYGDPWREQRYDGDE
jgi:DMSO/TMAO reductase YedYZ molybdopterin-dependent catalytic subunit